MGAFSAAEVFCFGSSKTELRTSSPAKSSPAFFRKPKTLFCADVEWLSSIVVASVTSVRFVCVFCGEKLQLAQFATAGSQSRRFAPPRRVLASSPLLQIRRDFPEDHFVSTAQNWQPVWVERPAFFSSRRSGNSISQRAASASLHSFTTSGRTRVASLTPNCDSLKTEHRKLNTEN